MAAGGLHDAGQGPERRDRSLRRFARRRPRPRQSLRTNASVRPLRRRAELHARQGLQRLARGQGRRLLPEVWISSMVGNFFFYGYPASRFDTLFTPIHTLHLHNNRQLVVRLRLDFSSSWRR